MKYQQLLRASETLMVIALLVHFGTVIPRAVSASQPPATPSYSQSTSENFTSIVISNSTLNTILSNPPVYIDKSLLYATVPSYATIGLNNTVKVLVYNNSDQPIPVFVRLEGPINVITVHPVYVEALVPPYGQTTANFTMVAFSGSKNAMINVTAVLYIWFYNQMNQPKQVDQVSDTIFGVHPYPYSPFLIATLAMLIIVPICLTTTYYLRLHKQRKTVQRVSGASP